MESRIKAFFSGVYKDGIRLDRIKTMSTLIFSIPRTFDAATKISRLLVNTNLDLCGMAFL